MTSSHDPTPAPPALLVRLAWIVALLVVAGAAITWVTQATRERIARNEAARIMKDLVQVLPAGSFDNQPDQDSIAVHDPALGSDAPLTVYRARRAGVPVAAVVTVVARQGYVGPIRLLVAFDPAGTVLGVHILAHQETAGVGDRIEPGHSGFLRSFVGRSLASPLPAGWDVRREGGEFDQLTGATTTSRAVVGAVRDAALWFAAHRADVFTAPAAATIPPSAS